jgi:hypothetical protein
MADWFLILATCISFCLLLVASVYFLVQYQHPDDRNEAWFPKLTVLLGLVLSGATVLLLPLDVANNEGYAGTSSYVFTSRHVHLYICICICICMCYVFAACKASANTLIDYKSFVSHPCTRLPVPMHSYLSMLSRCLPDTSTNTTQYIMTMIIQMINPHLSIDSDFDPTQVALDTIPKCAEESTWYYFGKSSSGQYPHLSSFSFHS